MIAGSPISCQRLVRLHDRAHGAALGHVEPDPDHGGPEQLAVLGLVDGLGLGADQLARRTRASVPSCASATRHVERGLPAHRRQHARPGRSLAMILRTKAGVIGSI